jgi:hypothetical protein
MLQFIREFAAAARSPLPYLIWAALTVVLTVSGPFDTYDSLPKPQRALYWAAVVAISIVIGKTIRILVTRFAGGLPGMTRQGLIISGVTLVLGPVIWGVSRAMIGPAVPALPVFLYFVFVVALGVQVIRHVIAWAQHQTPAAAAQAVPPGSRLLERIDPALRGNILRLSARNHYLEVQTDKGRVDLLLRFSDGLAEVTGLDGAQVHRSHWVAWSAVAGAGREGNRLFLRMQDGSEVSVSRRHEALLAERGLI